MYGNNSLKNDKMKRLIMNDDYLLELARNVCWLRIQLSDHMLDNITPEALYEVYEVSLNIFIWPTVHNQIMKPLYFQKRIDMLF